MMKITEERRSDVNSWWKFGVVLLAGVWLSLVAVSWANAGEGKSSEDDEYNFNWLDPEKKIYVLQNRRYLKANRMMFSAMAGVGFSNPYRTTYNFDPRVTYHLSEAWGMEAFFSFTANSGNNTFDALKGTNTNVQPVVREIHSRYGFMGNWVPWYAKINVFNKILYFDWYFSAGLGALRSTVFGSPGQGATGVGQDNFAFYWGTGHLYHITDNLLVRLDFTSAVYNAPVFGTVGGTSWYSDLNFGAGVGWRL